MKNYIFWCINIKEKPRLAYSTFINKVLRYIHLIARGKKRDFIYSQHFWEYEGVQWEYRGVRWEYDGSTREYDGSMGVRESRFFPLDIM
jgi:hypothetical protein